LLHTEDVMNLIEARKQANLTQDNIAELAGTSTLTVIQIEAGRVFPNKTTRERIEFAIGEVDWVGTRIRNLKAENGSSHVAEAILDYVHLSTSADRCTKIEFLRALIDHIDIN